MADVVIELFFKGTTELRQRVRFLRDNSKASYSLVNKNRGDDLVGWCETILEEQPAANILVHFSIKYNKCKAEVGVAFNPYFTSPRDLAAEKARLDAKLRTGVVSTVWLQFGSDTAALQSGLEWLRQSNSRKSGKITRTASVLDADSAQPATGAGAAAAPAASLSTARGPTLKVGGSLFLPNKVLIAQQKFRPWNGVILSEEYLSGTAAATGITHDIVALYKKHGVKVLVEAPGMKKDADLVLAAAVLAPYNLSGSGSGGRGGGGGSTKRNGGEDDDGATSSSEKKRKTGT
eukprot:gene15235-12117_t